MEKKAIELVGLEAEIFREYKRLLPCPIDNQSGSEPIEPARFLNGEDAGHYQQFLDMDARYRSQFPKQEPDYICKEQTPCSVEGILYNPNTNPALNAAQNMGFDALRAFGNTDIAEFIPIETELSVTEYKATNYYHMAMRVLQCASLKRDGEKLFEYLEGYYHCISDSELYVLILKVLEDEISAIGKPNMLKYVADYIKYKSSIEDKPLCAPGTVCVKNGIYCMHNRQFFAHDPHCFFTYRIEVDLYPDALMSCPQFDCFLAQITGGDIALTHSIWQMIGYLLSCDTKAKKLFILQGVSGSGKSVLGNLISSFFNPEAVSNLSIFQFEEKFSTSNLNYKQLNISMDLPNKRLGAQAVGSIKMITGQDSIMVEEKYKTATTYTSCCKLVFGTNHPLNYDVNDTAFASRLLVIPFRYAVPKELQNPNLIEHLKVERPAIVMKALNAYTGLVESGYQFATEAAGGAGSIPPSICDVVCSDEDVVRYYVQQACVLNPSAYTSTQDLYCSYQQFCCQNHYCSLDSSQRFSRKLNAMLKDSIKPRKVRAGEQTQNGYCGIALVDSRGGIM